MTGKVAARMKCQVLIDWLTFSVKERDPRVVIEKYLGLDPRLFQDMGYSMLGYNRVLRFSDICVCCEPRENADFQDMGICVSMSGNGCRSFETMSRLNAGGREATPFQVLFQLLASDAEANVSRIDIACDDREGYLDMDEMIKRAWKNEINSRLRHRNVHLSLDGSERSGTTLYIGAPSSDFRVRIYDKALERGEDGHWVRVELVLRRKNANSMVEQLSGGESVGKLAAQVINDKFSFIERDDSNITRCTICGWWREFVEEVEALHLVSRQVIQHSVERIENWLDSQIAPSLSLILQTMGWHHLFQMAREAAGRLSDKQLALISDYNALQTARLQAVCL